MRKFSLLLLSAVLLFSFSACSSSGAVKSGCLRVNGKQVKTDYVFKINDDTVSADAYRYYFMNMKYQSDSGDDSFWTEENAAELKDQVREYLTVNYAVLDYAKQNGITADAELLAEAESNYADDVAEYDSKSEFKDMLTTNYLTDEYYHQLLIDNLLQQKLVDTVFGNGGAHAFTDVEMTSIIRSEFVRVRYLALTYDETNREEKLALINELSSRISSGEDFIELVNEYGEDSTMNANPDGAYFSRGMLGDAFEDACYALEENELSGVVEVASTFYIIKRLPIEDTYVAENLDSLRSAYQQVIFSDLITELVDTYKLENGELYDSLDVWSMS